MKYWIAVDNEPKGPLTLGELKDYNINPDTLVWHPGLSEWTCARNIAELTPLYLPFPPEIPQIIENDEDAVDEDCYIEEDYHDDEPCPPTYSWLGFLTLLCCIPLGLVSIHYASRVKREYSQDDIDEAKRNSEKALTWGLGAILAGIVWAIFRILYILCTETTYLLNSMIN